MDFQERVPSGSMEVEMEMAPPAGTVVLWTCPAASVHENTSLQPPALSLLMASSIFAARLVAFVYSTLESPQRTRSPMLPPMLPKAGDGVHRSMNAHAATAKVALQWFKFGLFLAPSKRRHVGGQRCSVSHIGSIHGISYPFSGVSSPIRFLASILLQKHNCGASAHGFGDNSHLLPGSAGLSRARIPAL